MKTLVLSALISAAAMGNSMATTTSIVNPNKGNNTETIDDQKSIDVFKDQIDFHKKNVDVLWNQYDLAKARIQQSRGNHAELEREKTHFISLYKADIAKGIRVEQSKKAIAEIESIYAQKHAERDALENKQIARLQAHLKAEFRKEEKKFNASKKKYAKLVNAQTQPFINQAEQHFAQSAQRVEKLISETATSMAAI